MPGLPWGFFLFAFGVFLGAPVRLVSGCIPVPVLACFSGLVLQDFSSSVIRHTAFRLFPPPFRPNGDGREGRDASLVLSFFFFLFSGCESYLLGYLSVPGRLPYCEGLDRSLRGGGGLLIDRVLYTTKVEHRLDDLLTSFLLTRKHRCLGPVVVTRLDRRGFRNWWRDNHNGRSRDAVPARRRGERALVAKGVGHGP